MDDTLKWQMWQELKNIEYRRPQYTEDEIKDFEKRLNACRLSDLHFGEELCKVLEKGGIMTIGDLKRSNQDRVLNLKGMTRRLICQLGAKRGFWGISYNKGR